MKCKGCGRTVIRGQIQCVKCGKYLSDAAEYYDPSKIYRPRLTLYFKALFGAAAGRHLDWLGRYDEADRIRIKYNRSIKDEAKTGLDMMIGAAALTVGDGKNAAKAFGSFLGSTFRALSAFLYHLGESTFILFGKYRKDQSGHPIRWFKPDDTPKKKAATVAAAFLMIFGLIMFIFGPAVLQQIEKNKTHKNANVSTNEQMISDEKVSDVTEIQKTENQSIDNEEVTAFVTKIINDYAEDSGIELETTSEKKIITEETSFIEDAFGSSEEINLETKITIEETTAAEMIQTELDEGYEEFSNNEAATDTVLPDSELTLMHITSKHTYLYDMPSTDYETIESHALYIDDTIEVIRTEDEFYFARTADGNGGYIYGYVLCDVVAPGAGTSSTDQQLYDVEYITVSADTANVRSTPDKERSDNFLGIAYKGDTFNVYSYNGYWYEIDYYGTTGYISYKMVK